MTQPGDTLVLFGSLVAGVLTGESPTPPQMSLAMCRGLGPMNVPAPILFHIIAPSGVVSIYGSNVDIAADYLALPPLFTATDQTVYYQDAGNFLFYVAYLSSGTGPVTVVAQR